MRHNRADSMSSRHKNMLGAPPSMPAGAFISPKNRPYIFLNIESRFLCLRDIKYALFVSSRHKNMLGAPPSMPAGAFISPKNRPSIFKT